jgi:hypothetical protein
VWQDGNTALGNQTINMAPWSGNAVSAVGTVTVSGYATVVSPIQPFSTNIFGASGKRWCQSTTTNQATDPGQHSSPETLL